ncbi:uncharacterized protein [Mycetomoellerius zeteki]|uniref:uncharacterized protein n=1 Tax=Mycetomoellerius zeteki TaxID=64791 RepID=UPI00084EBB8B|nr:PREDICTED: uncharacterized protein LOC108730672 [Trachymyrmex zeteki]
MFQGCRFEVPREIMTKRAVINVRSMDNPCFAWSVVAALYPAERNADRESSYPHYTTVLNFQNIEFPITLKDITKFERLNDVSINVYIIEGQKTLNILPIQLADDKKEKHVNLLYLRDPRDDNLVGDCGRKRERFVSEKEGTYNNITRAGCRFEVPREIMTKRAVINVRSMDNACFAWSVVAALYPAERNADRESSYPHYTTVLNFQNIEFPITLKDITKFERLNDVSINVYIIERQKTLNVLPIRLADDKKEKHVNLLYLRDPRDDNVGHFAWIKNISRLMSSQLNKHNGQKYICDRCLHYFHSNERLQLQMVNCVRINDCAIRLSSDDDKWLSFNNYNRKERVPFVVYADLKCILEKTDSDQEASTLTYQLHYQVFNIEYCVRCSYDNSLSKYRFCRDPDCVSWFVEKLRSLAHCVKRILAANVPMETLSSEQWETLHSATHCHVCEKPFALDDNRLQDTCLPPRESFYSSLTGHTVTESDYAHAVNVWQQFSVQTLGEYSDLYLKTDVLLLADIFENFRDKCIESYGLDPAYYYTLPGFTWDAMLKHTRVNFELLTDIDMVMFIERGIRGVLSQCSSRYARANNKYMQS